MSGVVECFYPEFSFCLKIRKSKSAIDPDVLKMSILMSFAFLVFFRQNDAKPFDPKDFMFEHRRGEILGRMPGTIHGRQFMINNCEVSFNYGIFFKKGGFVAIYPLDDE
jgi:hypothetical protein